MGSKAGVSSYEFKKNSYCEKAVATEVLAVGQDELEKAVAEEIKVEDPPNAQEVIKKATSNERGKDTGLHSEDSEKSES